MTSHRTADLGQTPQRRFPEIDGLRGLAVLLVVAYHYIAIGAASPQGTLLSHFREIFRIGWCGVDLFFVLSGFLIGGILLDVRESSRYFQTFYLRRLHRIVPIYYLFVFAYGAAALLFSDATGSLRMSPLRESYFPVHLLFLQNIRPRSGTDFTNASLSPLWSLAVEEQFYLVAPLLVRFLPRRRLLFLLTAAIFIAPVLRTVLFLSHHPGGMYILTPSRMDALSLGVLAALLLRTQGLRARLESRPWFLRAPLIALAVPVALLAAFAPQTESLLMASVGFSAFAAFFATLLLYVVVFPGSSLAAVCRTYMLAVFGGVSYCMYLIHMPVNWIVHWVILRNAVGFRNLPEILTTALAFMVVWGTTRLSFAFFENLLTRRGHRYQY